MAGQSHKRSTHAKHQPVNEKNLLAATILNLVITAVEIAGSILSGSLALLSDALHNLSDTFATFIAYLATLIGKKNADPRRTFGYKRAEILAALFNAVILLIMCFFLIKEAWERLQESREINSMIMIVVAMIGLLANIYAASILKRDAHKSINVKAAYVHLVGDALSSVLVLAGAILIRFMEWSWLDPLITGLISIYIIREAFVILKEAVSILMQSAPEHLDLDLVKKKAEAMEGVRNIHHIHAWMLTDQRVHLEAHVELEEDLRLSEAGQVQAKMERMLKRSFRIRHITLQLEYRPDHATPLIQQDKVK